MTTEQLTTTIVAGCPVERSVKRPNFSIYSPTKDHQACDRAQLPQQPQRQHQGDKYHNLSNGSESSWKKIQSRLHETALHRTNESKIILEFFEDSNQKLLLVEGPCGAGKTRLIQQTLSPKVKSLHGYILVAKFDPLPRPEPYMGFCSAFAQFVMQVVQNNAVAAVQKALSDAGVGDKDLKVLEGMIPMLHQIFTNEAVTSDSRGVDHHHPFEAQLSSQRQPNGASRRFSYVFLMFVRAISSLGVPIVLLLDDLHFADQCSWQILSNIVADLSNCPSLLVVITYDKANGEKKNSCSTPSTILMEEAIEKMVRDTNCNTVATRVSVGNLRQEEVTQFLSDVLDMKCSPNPAELVSLVFHQTNGNLFYVMEYLTYLLENNLLETSNMGWCYGKQKIQGSMATCCSSISDFVLLRLKSLSPDLQQFLKVASCFGTFVPFYLLQCIFGERTKSLLQEASTLGLLNKSEQSYSEYSFPHDIMQQVVYDMIPTNEKEQFHLEIGRRTWNTINPKDLNRSVYVLTAQFYFAKTLVMEQDERFDVAGLCLLAGRNAAASSTFRTACVYLNLGIEFLGEWGWRDHYQLSLALYNAAAEMHLCVADFNAMERLVEVVTKEARPIDRIQSETTRVYAMGMTNKQNEAIDLGIQLLARLGETFPRRLCNVRVLIETIRVQRLLMGKSDEELLCLPTMEDPEKLACIQILNVLFLSIILVRPRLTPFVTLKFTSLTLRYGQCLMSPIAFAYYGIILCGMGRIDEAFRFGELGIKMLQRSGQDESLPRVYAAFYGVVYPVKRPITEAIAKLHEGYQVGLQTGDFEFACLNANLYANLHIDSNTPLQIFDKEYERIISVMTALGQETMLLFSMPCVQSIHHAMGLTENPLSSKGELFDYEEAYQWCLQNKQENMANGIIIHRLVLSCVFNDFAVADIQATRCLNAISNVPCKLDVAFTLFYVTIVYLENATNNYWRKRQALRTARRALTLLKQLSLICPYNSSHMRLLLEAEVAKVNGQETIAFQRYTWSIACARSHRFLMSEAFGNERCGRFLYKFQRIVEARSFFDEACCAYERWGGMAKVIRLKEEMLSLFGSKTINSRAG